jgi:hypothetical protein
MVQDDEIQETTETSFSSKPLMDISLQSRTGGQTMI